jgi:hypothetical protein
MCLREASADIWKKEFDGSVSLKTRNLKSQDTYVFLLAISVPSLVETCEGMYLGFTATYFVVAFPCLI